MPDATRCLRAAEDRDSICAAGEDGEGEGEGEGECTRWPPDGIGGWGWMGGWMDVNIAMPRQGAPFFLFALPFAFDFCLLPFVILCAKPYPHTLTRALTSSWLYAGVLWLGGHSRDPSQISFGGTGGHVLNTSAWMGAQLGDLPLPGGGDLGISYAQ